jgi:hypothetical protein
MVRPHDGILRNLLTSKTGYVEIASSLGFGINLVYFSISFPFFISFYFLFFSYCYNVFFIISFYGKLSADGHSFSPQQLNHHVIY